MKTKCIYLALLSVSCFFSAEACTEDGGGTEDTGGSATRYLSIIPQPVEIVYGDGQVKIPAQFTVCSGLEENCIGLLSETLDDIGCTLSEAPSESAFLTVEQDSGMDDEEYGISMDTGGCAITYGSSAGLLWGVQTLRQILWQISADGTVPAVEIRDVPAKPWRGFQLDVSRHIFSFDYLKSLADLLSLYKINKFQLHLTDDQGWRLEINRYPELTTTGAWRQIEDMESDNMAFIDPQFIRNGTEYGGYYTQEQMKELVSFASARGIEIIPEIDIPGHSSAAIRAYPGLSCSGGEGWGDEFSHPLCAGKDYACEFFRNVLDEVTEIFGGSHVHIGGDEVETEIWSGCPDCQTRISGLGLDGTSGLLNWFIGQMSDHVSEKGMTPMVWDDAFVRTDPLDVIYTFWRDWLPEYASGITQMGYPLVFMEWGHFYLSADVSDTQLQNLYEFRIANDFPGVVNSNVIGWQAACFTEKITYEDRLSYHIFPSLFAYSELAWGTVGDWEEFKGRIPWHLGHLEDVGMNYRLPDFIR